MADTRPVRIAIIGCGLIADQHAAQLRFIEGCELVAVCDTDPLMAGQLAERFHVPSTYTDARQMLEAERLDVVHVTTHAQSHYALACLCMEHGCHVYVEKPFTVHAAEADDLLARATSKGLRITVGHNLQFSPEAERLRRLVAEGAIGGRPLHIESIQCYSHDDPTYGRVVLADPGHWVRSLPGSLLHNLVSHGVAKVAEFLSGSSPDVTSVSFSSRYLQDRGHGDIVDEVRAVVTDETGVTAFFLFTTQFGVATNELRLFGRAGNLALDNGYRTVVHVRPPRHKSYLRYFLSPLELAKEMSRNTIVNMRLFWRKEFQMDYGMRRLMEGFYRAIRTGAADPLSHEEIRRTAHIMEQIFRQMPKPIAGVRPIVNEHITVSADVS